MEQRAKDLISKGDHLFGKKATLDSLMQELADNFYVERADFTRERTLGTDMAAHLMSSYPMMVRRDLQNAISTMLRPVGQKWFDVSAKNQDSDSGVDDQEAKAYLESRRDIMWRAMYDRKSQFARASKEGDGDFVTFGQCVKQVLLNRATNTLLYRCYHLRDCAWAEGYDGEINTIHRKWKPTIRALYEQFGEACDPKVKQELDKTSCDPFRPIECRHIIVPSSEYDLDKGKKDRFPYVSVYVDVENQHVIEEIPQPSLGGYIIPRWVTVSGGWQYAFSPATVCALPDARLLQAMTRVLLEAAEISIYPPALAVENVIRGDINRYASGITWVDSKYAGKLSEAFYERPSNVSGINIGQEMQNSVKELLSNAFFLNKLNLPARDGSMTAYEVSQRVQEYIRNATPLFEPVEFEDNGRVCEETFNLMMRNGGFGPANLIPESLRGQDIQFEFHNPLTEAIGTDKQSKFQLAGQMLQEAMQLDPGASANLDAQTALRDTLDGIGIPAKWVPSLKDVAATRAKIAQDQQAAQMANQINQGALVAQNVGAAGRSLQDAGMIQQGE